MPKAKKINFQYKIGDRVVPITEIVLTEAWDSFSHAEKVAHLEDVAMENAREEHFSVIESSITEDN